MSSKTNGGSAKSTRLSRHTQPITGKDYPLMELGDQHGEDPKGSTSLERPVI